MKKTRITAVSVAIVALSLHGCAGVPMARETPNSIEITSDPGGATALVDGVEIGKTPLRIDPAQHFKSGFVGLSYRYFGKLVVRKPGCADQVLEVDDAVLSKDINLTLNCDPALAEPASTAPPAQPATGMNSGNEDPYAERLQRIEMLYRKGLLREDEYRAARKRIIDRL